MYFDLMHNLSYSSVKLRFHVSGGKAKDLQVPHSASAPFFVELNYLRNQSDIIKDKMEAQMALVREQTIHLQIKLSVKQKKTITDGLQRKIEILQTEKTKLEINKTSLGTTDFHSVFNDNIQYIQVNSSCM